MHAFRKLYRDPLVHFLALGALMFGVASLRKAPQTEREIIVTRATREELARELLDERGKSPSAGELSDALRRWKRDEALYREGLRIGLDRNDAQVRTRVITNVLDLQKRLFVPPAPLPEQLDAWLERNRTHYEIPVRYDFEHVFASKDRPDAKARALEFVKQIEQGRPASELGDRFAGGAAFAAQTPERIRMLFGAAFATDVPKLTVGRWSLLASDYGWHAVRLRLAEGGLPPRELLGSRLVYDFQSAAVEKALADYTAKVEAEYRFREEH